MTDTQMKDLERLIERARAVTMTEGEIIAQRRSFAYGNSAFENSKITKDMVEGQADKLGL